MSKSTTIKLNSKLALLRGIKGCLPLETRKMFSGTHILPHMDYCSTVWGDSPHVHSLQLVQKRVMRTILDGKGKAIRALRTEVTFCFLSWDGWISKIALTLERQSWFSKAWKILHLSTWPTCSIMYQILSTPSTLQHHIIEKTYK